ncbi:hypothetical protein L208DRAFT_1232017, partial [Tricholoma matsutake]
CFVCKSQQPVEDHRVSSCPWCSPAVTLDLSQGQQVLEHIGAHILHNPGITQSTENCGLCLWPPPFCKFFLAKEKGANHSLKINQTLSRGCLVRMKYLYSVAVESSPSSPCSNVPITCPLCSKTAPAVWKYFLKAHFQEAHKSALLLTYEHIWKLSNFETAEMKKIWVKQGHIVMKCVKKSKIPPLVISKSHRAQITARYCVISLYQKGGSKFLPYCSHSDLDSDEEHDSNENTGDEGTKESEYERVVDRRKETQETEILPDSPTVNAEVLGPSQTSEDMDMAPPVHSNRVRFIS